MTDTIPDEAFPERMKVFSRHRKMTFNDHVNRDPADWCDYIRKDIADAAGWQPIETAPKDCVIDLWSTQSGRYPDAIWDACCGVEGWTDANDHQGLEGSSFTHWRHRPAGPKKGDSHE
jgi:hypothetical protein